MTVSVRKESQGLTLSILGGCVMAGLGIGFAVVTHSEAVLLDGIFSLVGTAVAMVGKRVASLVRRPDDEHFHFGYAAYEPMLNLIKGLLIAVVSIFALVSAVVAITEGGRLVRGGTAVIYAIIAAVGCFAIAATQRRLARQTTSPLLVVDAKNWFVDGLISSGVALAFLATTFMQGSSLEWFLPFVDPSVVIGLAVLSSPIPILIVRANWTQLMGRAPDTDIQREARKRVAQALEGTPGLTPHLRLLETGRSYYVQLYLVLDPEYETESVADLDRIRGRLHRALVKEGEEIGLDVIFTRDPRWTRYSIPAGSEGSLD
jgi:cation diffusion facilitator family transporter